MGSDMQKKVSKAMPDDILRTLETIDYSRNDAAKIDHLLGMMKDMLIPSLPHYQAQEAISVNTIDTPVPQKVLNVFNRIKYAEIVAYKAHALRQALPLYIKSNLTVR